MAHNLYTKNASMVSNSLPGDNLNVMCVGKRVSNQVGDSSQPSATKSVRLKTTKKQGGLSASQEKESQQ